MTEEFIASRLLKLREQKGLTARDMSLSIGQSESYINKIENKRIKPSITVLFYICDHLNITAKDFFDEGNEYPEHLRELIENLKKLDDEALEYISGIVKLLAEKNDRKYKDT